MAPKFWQWTLGKGEGRRMPYKVALLATISALITLMVSPNLNLVSLRYEEGDLISQDIVISDNVELVDEHSTSARREEALEGFPPIYDYDAKLKATITDRVRNVFQDARDLLTETSQEQAESQARIRANSLDRLTTGYEKERLLARMNWREREKRAVVARVAELADLEDRTPAQGQILEKYRFELRTLNAHLSGMDQALAQMDTRLDQLRTQAQMLIAEAQSVLSEGENRITAMRPRMEEAFRTTIDEATFQPLLQARFSPEFETEMLLLLSPLLDQLIVASLETFAPEAEAIQLQTLDAAEPRHFEELATVTDVSQVREDLVRQAQELEIAAEDTNQRQAVVTLAQRLVQPNLTENRSESERQRQELGQSITPVFFNLKKGDVVARAGERASAQQVEIIRALNAYNTLNPKYPQLIGTFLIILIGVAVFYQLVAFRSGEELRSFSRLVLMSILLLLPLLFAEAALLIVPGWTLTFDLFPPETYNFLIPAALASLLGGVLLRFEVGLFLGFSVSLCMAILLDNSLTFFVYALLGSFVAAMPIRSYVNRYALWRQGLRISAINVPVILVLALVEQVPLDARLAMSVGAGLLNGFVVSFLAAAVLPFLESAFDITTNMRLLELSNMNHPALKEMSVRAPGTYHHSIVVGNLAESAAEGIAGNALLARVASYYHDLGKMLCPLYFVENQNSRNFHDDLPAHTSAQIIISHVKNGLEIAKRHRLGMAISDILEQHHGTGLVRYFFHKAQEEQTDLGEPPKEADFRYPGPKPQTKEAGLVMLADITESAIRSLEDPSEEGIRLMVRKQATRIYSEGQLDESGLTFNDLNYIEKTFTRMLQSIHHHRISYPEMRRMMREELVLNGPDFDDGPDSQDHTNDQPTGADHVAKHPAAS